MLDIDLSKVNACDNELTGQSDRAAAIVGASLLETQLEELLSRAMLDGKTTKNLLEGHAPLSTFSAKIDIILCLGLLPSDVCTDLHLVRKIRNEFAHSHGELSFESSKLAAWVGSFGCLEAYRFSLKHRKDNPETWRIVEENRWQTARRQFEIAVTWLSIYVSGHISSIRKASPLPLEYHNGAQRRSNESERGSNL